MAFTPLAFGPGYVYQGSGITVGISLLQTSGVLSDKYVMIVTDARIDGMSCLPGTLLGAPCGNTGISLTMLCDGDKERVNPPTNNYPGVFVYSWPPYKGDYFCWNTFFKEPAMDARIVAIGARLHDSVLSHTLQLTFQLVDYPQQIPVGDPYAADLSLLGTIASSV